MLAAIAAEAEWLAKGDDARFMSDVALRLQSRVTEPPMPVPPMAFAARMSKRARPSAQLPDDVRAALREAGVEA